MALVCVAIDQTVSGLWYRELLSMAIGELQSYARKLVTGTSGGVFDLLDPVLERRSFDEFGELV